MAMEMQMELWRLVRTPQMELWRLLHNPNPPPLQSLFLLCDLMARTTAETPFHSPTELGSMPLENQTWRRLLIRSAN